MSASRETFDLFSKYGRRHFIRDLRTGKFCHLVWRDTFAQIYCKVFGRVVYDSNEGGCPPDYACRRCCKYVPSTESNNS